MEPAYGRRENACRRHGTAANTGAAMEPAYGRRENRVMPSISASDGLPAAMEPAYGRRENPPCCAAAIPQATRRNGARLRKAGEPARRIISAKSMTSPQWSPPTEGGRTTYRAYNYSGFTAPQWSPPTEGGRTVTAGRHGGRGRLAAMEPAYGRRENPDATVRICHSTEPQWSPPTEGGRTVDARSATATRARGAAMEPAYGRRENRTSSRRSRSRIRCRNGARLRKAGEPGPRMPVDLPATLPQWSPPTEGGRTGHGVRPAYALSGRNGARLRKAGERLAGFEPGDLRGWGVVRAVTESIALRPTLWTCQGARNGR